MDIEIKKGRYKGKVLRYYINPRSYQINNCSGLDVSLRLEDGDAFPVTVCFGMANDITKGQYKEMGFSRRKEVLDIIRKEINKNFMPWKINKTTVLLWVEQKN